MSRRPQLPVSPFDLLLPYQLAWVRDPARFKIWLKSRQIGGSLAAAFEIVADAIENKQDWVVLSAGERQALEFMEKVHRVADIFADAMTFSTGRPWIAAAKAGSIRFPNGARILALPANPATARGYSANVLLDEFAFQTDPDEIWKAVFPIITNPLRGSLKLRIISTPAGKNSKFFELWDTAPDFSRHKTDIYAAKDNGLAVDIEALKANLNDPDAWAQEFECRFMHAAEQLFPVDIIRACQHAAATVEFSGPPRAGLYLGVDIGRHRDLTVPWTLEHVDGTYWTREVLELEDTPYAEQQELLLPRIRRARHAAVDATGLGGPIAEDLVTRLGKDKVTAIHFTNERKRELFSALKRHLQAGTVRIPLAARFRDDLASLQRIVTPSGVIKFHAAHTKDGHADRATALALALHAAALHPQKTLPCETAIHYGPQPLRHHRPRRTRFRPAWH